MAPPSRLVIATRASRLALWQAGYVRDLLQEGARRPVGHAHLERRIFVLGVSDDLVQRELEVRRRSHAHDPRGTGGLGTVSGSADVAVPLPVARSTSDRS